MSWSGTDSGSDASVLGHERAAAEGAPARIRGWRRLLALSPQEASVPRRGFRCPDPATAHRLEEIGTVFLEGYHAALAAPDQAGLLAALERTRRENRGFAYEGAAMGVALLGHLLPWRRHALAAFVACAAPHVYMVHVGAGWALGALRLDPRRALPRFDPLLRWLVLDGYGFHHGYFRWPMRASAVPRPRRLRGYELRAFDQGLGRVLWFREGGRPAAIAEVIARAAAERRPDLWSGVGLAAAYAGGVTDDALAELGRASGAHRPALAQGACFAAAARETADTPAEHTDRATRALCGLTAREAAALTATARAGLEPGDPQTAYERWRLAVQGAIPGGPTS